MELEWARLALLCAYRCLRNTKISDLLANSIFNNWSADNSVRSSFNSRESQDLESAHLPSSVFHWPLHMTSRHRKAQPAGAGLGGQCSWEVGCGSGWEIHNRHPFRAALQLCPLGHPPVHPGKTVRHPITSWCLRFCIYKPGPGSLPRKVPAVPCGVGDTLPHSPSATADTSSCSARISLASLVRYWQRRSSCCSTVAMRRERVCRQFITDGSALACGRDMWDSDAARVLR